MEKYGYQPHFWRYAPGRYPAGRKDINESIMKVNLFLALAATLLSLIGMYNLVSLDIIRRTKEMGIRKIQGASVPLIMFLVSKKFLIVLIVASILGCHWWLLYVSNAS
jgi:ABC-type antimicrobial peptide transport system permease subunit